MKARSDQQVLYKAVQSAVRGAAGKQLTPLLKRWRYTQSSDFSELVLKPGTHRFLVRYGLLDAGKEYSAQTKTYQDLLIQIGRASGDAPGVVAAWLEIFAAGEYGVLQDGICAAEPRCTACTLNESCRYLAAGGKDSRSFGQSMGDELLRSSNAQPADLRIADLLAFVVSGEKAGASDIARAEALLKACGGLRGLLQASPEMLHDAGWPDAARAKFQAVAELCRQWAQEKTDRGKTFSAGQDFYDYFHLRLRDLKKELFIVALLDQKNRLISDEVVSEGSLTETLVHPREVFAQAIAKRAAAVAMIHNHPSGDPAPSTNDKMLTKRLDSVARLVGIRLLDHVIIGDGRFFSFVEEGLFG